jgi:hypothetical protein
VLCEAHRTGPATRSLVTWQGARSTNPIWGQIRSATHQGDIPCGPLYRGKSAGARCMVCMVCSQRHNGQGSWRMAHLVALIGNQAASWLILSSASALHSDWVDIAQVLDANRCDYDAFLVRCGGRQSTLHRIPAIGVCLQLCICAYCIVSPRPGGVDTRMRPLRALVHLSKVLSCARQFMSMCPHQATGIPFCPVATTDGCHSLRNL